MQELYFLCTAHHRILYRGRTVEFNTKVDPDIIGGGILEIGYWRIDASIAGQLKRVKKQFIEKNRRIV